MKLTFWEIAEVVGSQNDVKQWPDFEITGVEFDSRMLQSGNLFVPLKGQNDGHLFIQHAIEKNSGATFWSLPMDKAPINFPVIQVTDTLKAFQQLAAYYLKKIKPTVIAITGSNGKTTTKDMTESILSKSFSTYKTQGNYNNEIGLPYTILHMPDETEKLILEMGMDHAGDIALLSELAQPDIAAITMIGEAHIENLGSREKIAAAKMEIVTGLKKSGLLLVPQEELLSPMLANLLQTIQTFGDKEGADMLATNIQADKNQTTFTVPEFSQPMTIPVPGKYNVTNALIAIAIGRFLNVPEDKIRQGLATFQLTQNRTQWLKTSNNVEILSDVYNANPTAMKAVLESFSKMPTEGKRLAVLGDMLELGKESENMHRSMKEVLNPATIPFVFLYGSEMYALYESLQEMYDSNQLYYFKKEDKQPLIKAVQEVLQPKDMIVLKASNGMGLGEVVTTLVNQK